MLLTVWIRKRDALDIQEMRLLLYSPSSLVPYLKIKDLVLANGFLDMTPKAKAIKKIDKLGFIKLKNFYVSKSTIKKV